MIRIYVGGDRNWEDYAFVEAMMKQIRKETPSDVAILWISGGASGVDHAVRMICERRVWPFCEFPAPWFGAKRPAGPIRNGWVIKFGKPDVAFLVHNDLPKSKGTKDMARKLRRAHVPTYLANRLVGYRGAISIKATD